LRLGVIPTALPAVAEITAPLLQDHPSLDLEIRSFSSQEIAGQRESCAIDAGITYLDNEPIGSMVGLPLYRERYVYLTAGRGREKWLRWAALDGASLCLLTPEMQNRRIVDAALQRSG